MYDPTSLGVETCFECGALVPSVSALTHKDWHAGRGPNWVSEREGLIEDAYEEVMNMCGDRLIPEIEDKAEQYVLDEIPWYIRWLVVRRLRRKEASA